jgi:phosphopantetheine--protein transferase-like protein
MVTMSIAEQLQNTLAELLNMSPRDVTPGLTLDIPKFRSSAGRAILRTALKARLGKDIDTQGLKTYSELLARVTGESSATASGDTTATSTEADASPTLAPSSVNGSVISGSLSCGVDMEPVATFPESLDFWNHEFYKTHFTPEETVYCVSQVSPRMHFAARWCAKEALKKSSPHYMHLELSQIQTLKNADQSITLQVRNNGKWVDVPGSVSLSHTKDLAIAMVIVSSELPSGNIPEQEDQSQ